MMDVLRYFLGSICFLSLVTLVIYVFKNTRTFKGQIWHKLLIASAIAFITAFLMGVVDVFFLPGKGLLYIAFIIWITGIVLLPIRGFIRWRSTQKAGAISFLKSVTIFPDTIHYIVSFFLLAFIALPLWVSFIYNPFHVTSMWLDIAGLGVWALATLDLIIAQRKSRHTMQFITIAPNKKAIPQARNDVLTVVAYGEFINSFLTKANPTAGNPDTDILTEYFEYNPILFEGCRLSEDGTIDVAPILQNLDRIPEENRIPVICTLFSMFNYKLMNLYSAFVSSRWTQKTLEDCYVSIKEEFVDTSALSNILSTMPKGVLENEKLTLLSKKELEVRVRERTLELEESQEQLRMLKDFHEEIVEKAPVGILRTDKEGRIEFVNPKAAELIGIPNVEEITTKGKKINDIFSVKEAQKTMSFEIGSPEHMDLLAHNMPSEETHTNLALTSIYGKNTETSVSVVSLSDKDGNFDGALFLIEDITERKEAEERERQMQQELNLASRLASVGELAAGIAHEINNPLTGILGFSERLLRKSTDGKAKQDLELIHNEAQRAARVVQNLLTFARRRGPAKEYSDVNDILQSALELRAYELETSSIEVVTDLAPSLPGIMVDYNQIEEVFLNIILNAELVMTEADSGGKLTIKTQQMKDYVRASFADDGPGIPAEEIGKVFDPFFTTRQERGGTGLGLSVCHGIVTEHGGRIYARSKPGKGATFFVELPCH